MNYRATRLLALGILLVGCAPAPSDTATESSAGTVTAAPQVEGQPVAKVRLTVTVTDIRNHKGQLIFGVFKTEKGFPSNEKLAVAWDVRPVDANTMLFVAELPPGHYAASILHDESGNNQLDTGFMGIPKEGYGVTNNPKPKFRAATFKEATFDLPADGGTQTISLQYF